jgi:hypothetical protein
VGDSDFQAARERSSALDMPLVGDRTGRSYFGPRGYIIEGFWHGWGRVERWNDGEGCEDMVVVLKVEDDEVVAQSTGTLPWNL